MLLIPRTVGIAECKAGLPASITINFEKYCSKYINAIQVSDPFSLIMSGVFSFYRTS